MTTFYLIRHGQHNRLPGDQPLNKTGRRQAQATAQHLVDLQIDAVYTSPLARARETAQAVANQMGLPLIEDERLRERANFGDLPGQTFEEFVGMWQRCDTDRDHVPEVGLSARANGERLEQWLRTVHAEFPQGTILAFSHGGTITDFLSNLFSREDLARHLPDFHHNFGNCSITIVHFDDDGFMLERLAAVDHLSEV